MEYAINKTKKYDLGEDILALGAHAKKIKQIDQQAINATIGALIDNDGKLYEFKSITEVFNQIDNSIYRAYPAIDGGELFKESVKSFVFQNQLDFIKSHFNHEVCATPGASGALYLMLSNYIGEGDIVLLPHIHWSNYKEMIKSVGATYQTYEMFEKNEFNVNDFLKKGLMIAEITNKLVVILNDPAHNPTGYSLSKHEFETIIKALDNLALTVPVVLIYDIAYIDYYGKNMSDSREKFAILSHVESNMLVSVAFSGSKSFGLYGFRLGALIGLSKSKFLIEDFKRIVTFKARATWSCSPGTGISVLNHLMSHEKEYNAYLRELEMIKSMLFRRGESFVNEAALNELVTYPYKDGFFVTIPVENPIEVFKHLLEKHVFVIPLDKAIRIAISSINEQEIPRLAKEVKDSIDMTNTK